MAESRTTKRDVTKDVTKPYIPTRNMESAVGSMSLGEVVWLDPSDARVAALLEAGYLQTQKDYLDSTDPAVVAEMERQGVRSRES